MPRCPAISSPTRCVVFPRDISACGFVGTLGLSTFGGSSPAGMIALAGRAGNPDAVFIQTSNVTGTLTSLGFHLSVQCPPAQRTGKVKILAGNTTAVVSVPGGIASASVGLATVQTNAGVAVQSVVPNVSNGTITIHLDKAPRQSRDGGLERAELTMRLLALDAG